MHTPTDISGDGEPISSLKNQSRSIGDTGRQLADAEWSRVLSLLLTAGDSIADRAQRAREQRAADRAEMARRRRWAKLRHHRERLARARTTATEEGS